MKEHTDLPIAQLRKQHYNATLSYFHRIHDDLAILRVQLDDGPMNFTAGQYTVLGLGYWEPRLPDTQRESLAVGDDQQLIRRAYSISCRLLADDGSICSPDQPAEAEFYIALVRYAQNAAPALTPRLFLLNPGDRLHMGRHPHGRYSLDNIQPTDNVVFCATGTGEAPHNAMITKLIANGHRGKIISVVSTRYRRDLAYLSQHRRLETLCANYRYLPLTTREPENLDESHQHYVGKKHIQHFLESGELESRSGLRLNPESTHVYVCGNPAMIGLPSTAAGSDQDNSASTGMVALLEKRGFRLDHPHSRGTIHVEQYW